MEIFGFRRLNVLRALTLSGLLLGLAVPSMTAAMDSAQPGSASGLLLSGLHLVRHQAISRNTRVVLCKSGDGMSCSSGGGWEQGWIVFHDANANGSREPSETILRREIRLASSVSVYGSGAQAPTVSFGPSATPAAHSAPDPAGLSASLRRPAS